MGIQEDIFGEFFKKLEEDGDFPALVVEEVRRLLAKGEIPSQEEILQAIERGCGNDSQDQDD